MKKQVRSFASHASSYGGFVPHGGILQNIALQDKGLQSEEGKKRARKIEKEKRYNERHRKYKQEHVYILPSFTIPKNYVQSYIDGDESIPGEKLALGFKGISEADEMLVRKDAEWQEFAKLVFNKLINQINGIEPVLKSTNRGFQRGNPNSWSQFGRKRCLIVKDILIRNKTETARLLFDNL